MTRDPITEASYTITTLHAEKTAALKKCVLLANQVSDLQNKVAMLTAKCDKLAHDNLKLLTQIERMQPRMK